MKPIKRQYKCGCIFISTDLTKNGYNFKSLKTCDLKLQWYEHKMDSYTIIATTDLEDAVYGLYQEKHVKLQS